MTALPMSTGYVGRHRDLTDHDDYPLDLDHPQERYQLEEVEEVLRAMPLDADHLGDGGVSDWTLSILFALAGQGDADAHAYLAPRVEHAARRILADLGYPGDAFQGA